MDDISRRRRRLWSVTALLFALVTTTGWAQAAASARGPATQAPTTQAAAGIPAPVNPLADRARPASALRRPLAAQPPVAPPVVVPVARSAPPTVAASPHSFSGRNHFWVPSLGISQAVYSYACGRTSTPANLIYRWGCGGTNNVYILGHAWGVMKPLHDAYTAGRLHVGMLAIYADGNGNIRSYRVTAWQVVRPTVVAWAIASQPVPSMTLQTCIGADSQWRLDVRLVAVD